MRQDGGTLYEQHPDDIFFITYSSPSSKRRQSFDKPSYFVELAFFNESDEDNSIADDDICFSLQNLAGQSSQDALPSSLNMTVDGYPIACVCESSVETKSIRT